MLKYFSIFPKKINEVGFNFNLKFSCQIGDLCLTLINWFPLIQEK